METHAIGGGRQAAAPHNKDFLNFHLPRSITTPYRAGSGLIIASNQTDTQTKGSNQRGNLEIQISSDHISAGGPAKFPARSPVRGQSDIRHPSTNILEARLPPDGHEHPETYVNGDSLSRKKIQISPGSYKQHQQSGGSENIVDASHPPSDTNIQIPSVHKYEVDKPGMSTFYPAVKLASPNKVDMDVAIEDEVAPGLPSEAPPSLPSGPPPPIPDDSTNNMDLSTTQNTEISVKTFNVNRDNTQNGATIDLDFFASGSGFNEKEVPRESQSQVNGDDSHNGQIRSYIEGIVTTAVTLAKENSMTNSTVDKPAMPTLLIDHDLQLSHSTDSNSRADTTESTRDKVVVSPVADQSDLSSSAGSLPMVRSLLLTSPRSYSGSRSGSRRSSIGSDAGSIASDIGSMRGAAPPLKATRRESVIETLEKKRRESIGPKLKGLQVPSRRASTGGQSGPMKALPTLAGLPAIGERKGFGIKPFRSVQPFSSKKLDSTTDSRTGTNTTEITLRTRTLKIQDPKQRWSYHGSDSVFDSPSTETTVTFGNQPPLVSKLNQRDEKSEVKPAEVKPVAEPLSFKLKETENRPSFHISVNTPETVLTKPDSDRPMSPKKNPPTAPKPAVRKPITVEITSSKKIEVKEQGALSPKSPPATAPKPKPGDTQQKIPIDHQPDTSVMTATSKPSLPPKPHVKAKPTTSSSSEGPLKSPLLSPTSPRSVVEDEIKPVTSHRIRPPVPELLSSPGFVGTNTESISLDRDAPAPAQQEPVKSPADIADLLQQDLQISPNTVKKTASPMSPYSPVNEPEIHAIISSRTVKTETTVTFFPSSPKAFLQPEILPSESQVIKAEARKTLSPSPVKVSETREIIKLETDSQPDIIKNTEAKTSLGFMSSSTPGNISSPTSPPTQGPIPFHRIRVPSDTQERDQTSTFVSSPPEDEQHHTFSLTLNVTSMRQGPKPFGASATSPTGDVSITGAEWITEKKDCDGDQDKGSKTEDELAHGQVGNAENPLLISVDNDNLDDAPPLPGAPPPSLPDCAPPPIPSGGHLLDDDVCQLSPAESGIKMDGSASDSATLESQSIDSLEDGLDYISSVPSSSNHSKTESEISITPSIDLTKPDSPASSTATLIQLNGDESNYQAGRAEHSIGLKGFDPEDASEGRASILSSPDGQLMSPSPTPSDADSGIGSNKSDIHKSDKGTPVFLILDV